MQTDGRFRRVGHAKCPMCNSEDTRFDEDLESVVPLSHVAINSLYFPDNEVHQCPYCPLKGTLSRITRHLKSECEHIRTTCGFCERSYLLHHHKRHIEQECDRIPCSYEQSVVEGSSALTANRCKFCSNLAAMKQHRLIHEQLEALKRTFGPILSDLSRLELSSVEMQHIQRLHFAFRQAISEFVQHIAVSNSTPLHQFVLGGCGENIRRFLQSVTTLHPTILRPQNPVQNPNADQDRILMPPPTPRPALLRRRRVISQTEEELPATPEFISLDIEL